MNSKESLELAILEYEKDLETDENNQWVKNVLKGLKEIKQDIESLEKIKNLRTTPNALETCLANYMNKCIELEKENQDLKEKLKEREEANAHVLNMGVFIHKENKKLKTVIDVLKNRLNISLIEDKQKYGFTYYLLSLDGVAEREIFKDDYEVLKEVLGE